MDIRLDLSIKIKSNNGYESELNIQVFMKVAILNSESDGSKFYLSLMVI